jgi:SpoVK/Ycf46/Vps4 family AAA+-type ATPase
MDESILISLRKAIDAAPDDIHLRLHLAGLLLDAGQSDEAISLAGAVLQIDPTNVGARQLIGRAIAPAADDGSSPARVDSPQDFDWSAAEREVDHLVEPMFAEESSPERSAFDVERSTLTLADVGGMKSVKERLTAAFLAPLRNPELRTLYKKSLRGGLLMYGPPGCGKTFIARALAGELGAKFLSVGIADILDPYSGVSENNVHELFQVARREAPVVLFFDEIDALGQRRSLTRNSGLRNTVNQLLSELDGVDSANEGVFVLAATNQPWDVDPALRRPGRFDRTVLVLPPDAEAREAIFRFHLASRPVEGIELATLARASEGLSGADIAYVCEIAAERALTDSALSGVTRMITMKDVTGALGEVSPSLSSWLDSARNVVLFGDGDGTYAELKSYLKKVKRL